MKIEDYDYAGAKTYIHQKLRQENQTKCPWLQKNAPSDIRISDQIEQNFIIYDNEKLVGGALGYIRYNWYYLEILWLDPEYRGRKIGSELLEKIKLYAREHNLTGIRLDTWDFQARGFYEKNGFRVFGELRDCPPGTIRYALAYNTTEED